MTDPWVSSGNRLRGKRILLLAETPRMRANTREAEEDSTALTSPVLEAEEAVMSLVRAIIAEGGEMILIADSSLALLASIVAGEYTLPSLEGTDEPPRSPLSVFIRGDEGFIRRDEGFIRGDEDEGGDPFQHLANLGYVSVERAPSNAQVLNRLEGRADAMVCIGTGSVEDVATFQRATDGHAPVFLIAATGTGTASAELPGVELIDYIVDREAPLPKAETDEDEADVLLPPVTLTAQWIVERLIER